MSYTLTLEERPSYLHAKVTGTHSPENAMRFLSETHAACVERGYSELLLEMGLSGPSLDTASIFKVITQRAPDALGLRRIAYVDESVRDLEKMRFAETVARNRGVNVRLFRSLDEAVKWMQPDAPSESGSTPRQAPQNPPHPRKE